MTWHDGAAHLQVRAALKKGNVSWSEEQRARFLPRPGSLEVVKKALVGPVNTGFFFAIKGASRWRSCVDFASDLCGMSLRSKLRASKTKRGFSH